MNSINSFIESINYIQIIKSIIIIIVSIILYKGIIFILNKSEEKDKFNVFKNKKNKTYLKLTRSIIRYIFLILTLLILLQINGIDVSSLLAGLGIAGVVVGLAIQDWLKDIIRGSSILSDHYFSVGDVVKYKDIEAKVLVIGLKTTKLQDLKTNNVISIANRKIEEIELVSNLIYISIPMPYETDIKQAEKVVNDIKEEIKKNDKVENCEYKGVNDLAESSIKYLVEITCKPKYKLQVRRDALRTILLEMDKNKISVPYTQIDVHTKVDIKD